MSDPAASPDEGGVGLSPAPDPTSAPESPLASESSSAPEPSAPSRPTPAAEPAPAAEPTPTAEPTPSSEPAQPPEQVFELRSPAPVRPLAIASAAAIAGAVAIVVSGHPAVTLVGALLLGFGVLLAVLAVALAARLRSRVRMDDSVLEVSRGRRRGRLAWSDIDRVQESRHQLIAVARNDQRDLAITLPGPRGSTYVELVRELKLRLDASRGYGG